MNSRSLINRVVTGCVTIGPFQLTSGSRLPKVTLHYERIGPVDAPVILICHALTGNQFAVGTAEDPGWWSGLIGRHKTIDIDKYQVITFNVLGGCDGSTGPTSHDPHTGKTYQADFPMITIRDMVHATYQALQNLQIANLAAVIGGSLGGMQVLEWGLLYPTLMEKLIVLAATPTFSDYGIAYNHIAETAIKNDPGWHNGYYGNNRPLKGLEVARMVGMVTYRSPTLISQRFHRGRANNEYSISSYLNYQGKKLVKRFDPNSYIRLLEAMNAHDIGEDRGGWQKAAELYQRPILMISFDKDLIYEPKQIREFAESTVLASYHHVQTDFGHDGFLTEFEKWGNVVKEFINP